MSFQENETINSSSALLTCYNAIQSLIVFEEATCLYTDNFYIKLFSNRKDSQILGEHIYQAHRKPRYLCQNLPRRIMWLNDKRRYTGKNKCFFPFSYLIKQHFQFKWQKEELSLFSQKIQYRNSKFTPRTYQCTIKESNS